MLILMGTFPITFLVFLWNLPNITIWRTHTDYKNEHANKKNTNERPRVQLVHINKTYVCNFCSFLIR